MVWRLRRESESPWLVSRVQDTGYSNYSVVGLFLLETVCALSASEQLQAPRGS